MAEALRDIVVNYVCRDRADHLWQFGVRSKPACRPGRAAVRGVCSLTRGNLAARHADCARLVDQSGKKGWQKRHGSTPGSSRVTRAGWLGSGWRQPASPQCASLGSGGVALRASTPGTPELWPAFEPCRKRAWFKTPAIRVTVLALSTGVGSCSGFCLPRSGGISLPGGASPRVGAVGSEPPILLTRTPNGGDSSTRAGPGVDCDQAPPGTP